MPGTDHQFFRAFHRCRDREQVCRENHDLARAESWYLAQELIGLAQARALLRRAENAVADYETRVARRRSHA